METEVILWALGIVGACGTMALSVNAAFLRGIFQDLNTVKIEIARIGERSDSKVKRIEDLEINQKELYNKINNIERKI